MRCAVAIVLAFSWTTVGKAQEAVARSAVNIRSGQSTGSSILDHLNAGDTVTLLSPSMRKSYYHVEAQGGTRGWVYSRYLELLGDSTPVATGPTPRPQGSGVPPTPIGAVASSVDGAWEKPASQVAPFHRAGFSDCGPVGQGGDTITDRRKNRTDEAPGYHPVTFDAILALPYPKNHLPQRTSWPSSDLAVLAPYEGIPVTVTAFIAKQRGLIVEAAPYSRNGEATNCHATDTTGVDWHVTLVKQPDDPKSTGIVVETTPRVRAHGHPWTPDMLAPTIAAGDSVRVSGWLLYDPEHFAQTTNYDPARPSAANTVRATLWEVHPVTRIEVFDGRTRQWRALP
jgi:uncharacterized protein YraI